MTFMQSVSAAGDYLLSKAVGEVDAGACVGSVHQACGGYCGKTSCNAGAHLGYYHFFSCYGACVRSPSGYCC